MLVFMNLSLSYLSVMLVLDMIIFGLKQTGLAQYAIIDTKTMRL